MNFHEDTFASGFNLSNKNYFQGHSCQLEAVCHFALEPRMAH